MKKAILSSVAAVALMAIAGVSAAQAADTPFAGGYAGIQGGYDIFKDQWNGDKFKGVEGGLFMGYNVPVAEKVILGGEVNFNLSDAHNSTYGIKAKNDYGISARAGFLASDNIMVYARGGYQRALINLEGVDSHHFNGWTLGAGIETALSQQISLRVEYVYAGYKSNSTLGVNPNQQNMNIGVAYHF
jgi:outer membrane immunogenic protein